MTQPKDIEGLRKVAEEARGRLQKFADEAADTKQGFTEAYVAAYGPGGRLLFAADLSALLSELEAVKGENARLFEANVMIREQQKEDFTRAQAAEAALVSLKEERGSSGGRVQAAPDGATEGQRSAGYKGVRLYTRRIEGGAGAHVIVEMERADGTSVEAIREYADISDSIIDHWARLPRPEEGK